MPGPPAGRCTFPKKDGNRTIWCGKPTLCVDGVYLLFCADCQKKYEKASAAIMKKDKAYRTQKLKLKGITINEGGGTV